MSSNNCRQCSNALAPSNHYGDNFRVCKSCWELFLQGKQSLDLEVMGQKAQKTADSSDFHESKLENSRDGNTIEVTASAASLLKPGKKSRLESMRLFGS